MNYDDYLFQKAEEYNTSCEPHFDRNEECSCSNCDCIECEHWPTYNFEPDENIEIQKQQEIEEDIYQEVKNLHLS